MLAYRSPRAVRLSPTDLLRSWHRYSPARAALVSLYGIPYPVERLPARAQDARGALIEHYLYVVGNTRVRLLPTVPVRVSAQDVEQAGALGLIRAVDRYDPARRVRFESYAIATVRGAMLEYLRQEDWAPRSVRQTQRRLQRARDQLVAIGEDEESVPALARAMEISEEDVYALVAEATVLHVVSLDDIPTGGDPSLSAADIRYADTSSVAALEPEMDVLLLDAVRRDALVGAIARLPSSTRAVLVGYYFGGESRRRLAGRLQRSERQINEVLESAAAEMRAILDAETALFLDPEMILTEDAVCG